MSIELWTGNRRVWTRVGGPTVARKTASTRLWTDAYLAAFGVAGDCWVVRVDKGFRQFDGLECEVL